ncbi:MAG: FGGY family carbohydrate kinase, partial [Phycisphaerales bacterium]
MSELLIGIDIGTSAAKAVAVDESGRVKRSAVQAYPLSQPRAGWSEQDPLDWWRATQTCLRELLGPGPADHVRAVGFSGQMHGSVLLDAAGAPVRPALLWNDQRTIAECATIERAFGGRAGAVLRGGNAAQPGGTLPKLRWARE